MPFLKYFKPVPVHFSDLGWGWSSILSGDVQISMSVYLGSCVKWSNSFCSISPPPYGPGLTVQAVCKSLYVISTGPGFPYLLFIQYSSAHHPQSVFWSSLPFRVPPSWSCKDAAHDRRFGYLEESPALLSTWSRRESRNHPHKKSRDSESFSSEV